MLFLSKLVILTSLVLPFLLAGLLHPLLGYFCALFPLLLVKVVVLLLPSADRKTFVYPLLYIVEDFMNKVLWFLSSRIEKIFPR